MLLTIEQAFQAGDKALFPMESSGMTYFALVKIEDILKIDKLEDDTYKILYTAQVYVTPTTGVTTTLTGDATKALKTLTVEESKLIKLEEFNNDIVTIF